MSGSRRAVVALLCLTAVCTLGGCTSILSDDITQEELIEKAESAEPPEEMSATVEVNATVDDEQIGYSYDVWYRQGGLSRVEGTYRGSRTVQVNDGDKIWAYNADEETVSIREDQTDISPLRDAVNITEELLRSKNATDITKTEYEGREVYHVVFDESATQKEKNQNSVLTPLVPSVGGILPGGQTDQAENETADGVERVELWIDAEYMYVLRQTVEGEDPSEQRYTDVEFEPGIDDDRFELDVPENATVNEIETPEYREFDSLGEFLAQSPVEIERPTFETLDAEFERGFFLSENNSEGIRVGIRYDVGQPSWLTVNKYNDTTETTVEGEPIQVDGVDGVYEEVSQNSHKISWTANGFRYQILASVQTDRETLIRLAESMETT
ncbi:LolA family protein [Halovenus salina]|uniref:LolA family protein n=1 Tax=Halovenus salina TaxID=1510225 RepID=UPI002260A5EB|nr:hypothetical protein [Halovenus salina]